MTGYLSAFTPDSEPQAIADALRSDGGVIISNIVSADLMDAVYDEVRRNVSEEDQVGNSALWPEGNKTVGGLAGVSKTFAEQLLVHPKILDVADAVLNPFRPMGSKRKEVKEMQDGEGPPPPYSVGQLDDGGSQLVWQRQTADEARHCDHYTVGACVMLEIGGGREDHQALHRENAIYQPFIEQHVMPEFILSTMWAGTDFTEDNGATRVVPGSHHWPESRLAKSAEIARAAMPKGSVVLWLSRTLHGAAKSFVTERRTGYFASYIADWFRQEENQYIAVPPETAATYSEQARQLIGYTCSDTLGWVKGRDRNDLLQPGRSGQL
ncbi:MAG: hypothetical protein GKR90_09940 [Pseudomonadales bacterium]|nr:hypothetical protein [Pseudomonadales bacterium]